jgi:hypothetical protein
MRSFLFLAFPLALGACGRSTSSSTTRSDLPRADEAQVNDVRSVVTTPGAVRWTTVADLLGDGVESCIDGRADKPVLGTPGGDVGEIVVALAALEEATHERIAVGGLDRLFDEYQASFGRLYFHSDQHAMRSLGRALRADERLAGVRDRLGDDAAVRDFVLAPAPAYQEALIEHLTRPENVGCGHVRLALLNSSAYHARAELVRAVIGATFRLAWRNPRAVDFEVLDGEHRETAVVEVKLAHPVHAHSRVAMVTPHVAGREVFVHHPDVAAFVRRENGTFFLEHGRELVDDLPAEPAYLATLEALGARQTKETVHRLAPSLPTVVIVADEPRLDVGATASEALAGLPVR